MEETRRGLIELDGLTTKDKRVCIETLVKIFKNVRLHPMELKYRLLKITNKRFIEEVWQHNGAQTIMLSSGWVIGDEGIYLPEGKDVSQYLDVLLSQRLVKPSEKEWVETTKVIVPNAARVREEELRAKALIEKEKEIALYKQDMAERKAIANRIIAEHRCDRRHREAQKKLAVNWQKHNLN